MAINIMCRIQHWELAWTQRHPCIYMGEKMLARVQKKIATTQKKIATTQIGKFGGYAQMGI